MSMNTRPFTARQHDRNAISAPASAGVRPSASAPSPHRRSAPLACSLAALLLLPGLAQAQIKTQPDGHWRQILGAGASFASGNSNINSFNLHYDLARQTQHHTVALRAQALYNTSNHKTSAHNNTLEFNGKRNLSERHYIFANTSWYRDRIANLSHRLAAAVGRGYQVTTTPNDDWSVFAGLGYSEDRYTVPTIVADQLRTRYGRTELTLGTESHHQLTDTTTAHQRLVFYPALNRNHDRRAELQADLSVSITRQLALTAAAELRYNSDPGTNIYKMDRRFITGVSWKLLD